MPVLPPATEAADCGGLLRSPAFCVTAQLDQIGALADAYTAHLSTLNWLAAAGDDNRVIFVRRRDGGQLIRWYRHCSQSRSADALGRENSANTRNLAFTAQRIEPAQQGALADAQTRRHFGKGGRAERKVALKIVQQAEIERLVHFRIRSARHGW